MIEASARRVEAQRDIRRCDDGVPESGVTVRAEAERARREEARKEMQRERKAEWLLSVRAREMRRNEVVAEREFENGMEDEKARAEAFFRRKAALAVQEAQIAQAQQKAAREGAEVAERRVPQPADTMYFLPDNEW
jgi:hypothetical protein